MAFRHAGGGADRQDDPVMFHDLGGDQPEGRVRAEIHDRALAACRTCTTPEPVASANGRISLPSARKVVSMTATGPCVVFHQSFFFGVDAQPGGGDLPAGDGARLGAPPRQQGLPYGPEVVDDEFLA